METEGGDSDDAATQNERVTVTLQRRGSNPAALAEFECAAKSEMSEAVYNQASLKIELGRHAEAIQELRLILQTHPDFKLARRRLAWAL